MGRIVGIDLGTTYSAVAIPEERAEVGFLVTRGCPGCSIIVDKLKRRITPSVVAEDERGNIIVGHSAKNRAGLSPEPIMFAKRYMGEDKTFPLGKQGALRPEEVSAHVLRYLKSVAEERLRESVEEAVITVPAYFSLRAKQMTEKAGELAGLRVLQTAPEPVAAALMYCAGDPRDPLRIMTYDLGGGTFDVAILEKRDGVISTDSILAFDGDRFLGGYDFDKILALWIMDQLVARGYALKLNLEAPADKVIFAKLMIYAERAKIKLSDDEHHDIHEVTTGITDHSGNPVVIEELTITREQFEAMIGKEVEYTIELCHRARTEKAARPIERDQFDEILMVGGSSRIPLVARRLEQEFGRKPKLVEPDLCVALGAAILADTKPKAFGRLKLNPIPAETDLPTLTIAGQVLPGDGLAAVENCTVTLGAKDDSYSATRTTGPEGNFAFDRVDLPAEEKTDFVLMATSPQGREVARHEFSVKQTQMVKGGGLVQPVTNMLAKPIGILDVDGLHEIAPARTPLPYEKVIRDAKTMDTSGEIRIPIVEENTRLGEIVMRDIPTTLPVGSSVEITLTMQENYQIRGRAYVPAIARDATVVIDIPVPPQKTLEELRREYETLAARAKDALGSASRGVLFGDAKAKRLKGRMTAAQEMLQGRAPEPAKIQDCLDEIESLIREIAAGWRPEPPRAAFEQKASEAHDLLDRAIKKKPKVAEEGYDKQLQAIRSEAEKAYTTQNTAAWKESFTKVVALCDRLESLIDTDGNGPPPDPASLLLGLARELAQLERWAKDQGRYAEFRQDFEQLAQDLKKIDPKSPDAMTQIRDWYMTKFSDLQRRLKAPDTKGLTRVPGQPDAMPKA